MVIYTSVAIDHLTGEMEILCSPDLHHYLHTTVLQYSVQYSTVIRCWRKSSARVTIVTWVCQLW